MRAEIITVTPPMAEEWLTHNYDGNRNIRQNYVAQLAMVMSSGRYVSENGQTIVFGEDDGVLYDGQHRLQAIVQSGVPQTLLVVWITNGKEAYKTIDNGTKRNAADFIKLPNRSNVAAVAKYMACVEWGTSPLLSCLQGRITTTNFIDRGLVVAYAEQNGDNLVDAVRRGCVIRTSIGSGAQSLYAFFIALVRFCENDAFIDEFLEELSKNASPNLTVTACRSMIMKTAASSKANGAVNNKWLLGTLLDAYHHFCEMDNSTMLNHQSQRITSYSKLMQKQRDKLTETEDA